MSAATNQALTHLQQRFAAWRRKRARGTHIPEDLWQAAVEAARKHGVWQVSERLGVDYYSLKRRLEETPRAATGARPLQFVEIPGKVLPNSPGCVVELQDREGLRLRVELREAAGAEGLARALWRERR